MSTKLNNAFAELEALEQAENTKLNEANAHKSTKSTKAKADKPKADKPKEEKPKPEAKVIDLTAIIAKLPTDKLITPATLDELFQLNDGGKTIRRHLRKHYATGHEAKGQWAWQIEDPILKEILQYFAQRYQAAK